MGPADELPLPGPVAPRERNPRGQGDRLRSDVIAALARIVSDDARIRPVSASLRELAREAGVTAPSIYRHFASIEEVARAVALDGFARLTAAMDRADEQATPGSAADRLVAQAHAYCRFATESRGHFRLMFQVEPAMFRATEADEPAGELFERWRRATSRLRDEGVAVNDVEMSAMYVWTAVHGRLALSPMITSVRRQTDDVDRFVELLVREIVVVGGPRRSVT